VATSSDQQEKAKARACAEARQYRAILLAFGDIAGWMKAIRNPAPTGPRLPYSAETRLAMRQEDLERAHYVRPTDSDWGLLHTSPEERSK
jgi:hypothetical protein